MNFVTCDSLGLDSVLSPVWAYIDSSSKSKLRSTSKSIRNAVDRLVTRINAPASLGLGTDIRAAGGRWPNAFALSVSIEDARSAEDAAAALDDRVILRLSELSLTLVRADGPTYRSTVKAFKSS